MIDGINNTTVLMVIVALNALATITLWREAVRRPARPSEKNSSSRCSAENPIQASRTITIG
jgi:hypothetical protein